MRQLHLYIFFISLLIWSCSGSDELEPIPSFIKIDSINLQTEYDTEGTDSHNIVDAWVYVENTLLGVFELPALVPYLGEGESRIHVFGGIMNNGMIENRSQYEFYEKTTDTLNLAAGVNTVYNPTVFYKEVDFVINDNFDFFTFFEFIPDAVSWSTTSDPSLVFEGTRSLKVDLNDTNPGFKMVTSDYYPLTPDGRGTYIEINYKTSSDFTVGIIPLISGQPGLDEPVINYLASDEWKKEYISIAGFINALNSEGYAIYITSTLSTEEESGTFLFDNIKLIQY